MTFSVDAYPDRNFEGKVTQVRLSATELQNIVTYTVIIEAANNDRKLFPGMTANVQIAVAQKDDALRVPNDALRFRPRGETADSQAGGGANRGERQISRLKNDLLLTDVQEAAVREEMKKLFRRAKSGPGGGDTGCGPILRARKCRRRLSKRSAPLLTDEQRPLFEKWKRGRENTKSGTVHVLGCRQQRLSAASSGSASRTINSPRLLVANWQRARP